MYKEDHSKITSFTIDYFEEYFSKEFFQMLTLCKKEEFIVALGSVYEDEFQHNLTRIHHWHFYRSENSPYLKPWFGFHRSSRVRYQHCVKKLHQSIVQENDTELMEQAGRVIHHIQDVGTPAHVIPIYHGPVFLRTIKDSLEVFSKKHIDEYLDNILKENMLIKQKKLPEYNGALSDFYDDVAHETLAYLSSKKSYLSQDPKITTEIFWTSYDSHDSSYKKGWGKYGNDSKNFGQDLEIEIDNKKYTVTWSEYEHIYYDLLENMIINTFKVLKYIERQVIEKI